MPRPDPSASTRDPQRRARRRIRPWERFALVGLVLAVAVSVAITVTARGDDETGAHHLTGEDAVAVAALLARWGDAVRTADDRALGAVVDRSAPAGFLDAERMRAATVAAIGMSTFDYVLADGADATVPAGLAESIGADAVLAPDVELRYAIDGIDPRPMTEPAPVLLARRGDRWTVVSDALVGDAPAEDETAGDGRWRGPWDFGTHGVVRTRDGSLVVGHESDAALTESVAEALPDAIAAVSRMWDGEWPRRAAVVLTATHDEFAALVGSGHAGANVAAVSVSDSVDREAGVATGQRIVFSPASRERLDARSRAVVLRHEMTHIAARTETVDGSPLWMLEGYAEYVANRGDRAPAQIAPELARRVRAGEVPESLPDDAAFTDAGAGPPAYEVSWSMSAFVADRYGENTLTRLYRALATGPDADVAGVFESVLGASETDVLAAWRSWTASTLG
ncbi:hypothetical protein DW322_15930 [Rhodococcus rhodnii]|uniref:Peptidase MA-like domain-containing protein n=2 Tax=Rhodococcus rhodnii TaxID=38312 RepID=R7WS72_9NOCA|nr:hypothetical protein [Rhodococcus rhodnii]EOM78161.1 hypothetical protein Rrhod_0496 [Rhodococcus rhodnii LMG 5362]TXG91423.1 hypothetical protein DW322_15930 [Rhodococcus rhodnii]